MMPARPLSNAPVTTMGLEPTEAPARGVPVHGFLTSTRLLLLGVVGTALLLRVLFLGTKSLWGDEAISVATARLDWSGFVDLLATHNPNMLLYMLLLRLWLVLGDSEWIIRSLSVIPAVVTVPALYRLGDVLFGRRVGLFAAAILAVNVFHIGHSQEARSYPLFVLLVTLSTLYFVKGTEEPSRKNWLGYVVASALAVYSHLFGVLLPIAHWVSLAFMQPRRIPWKSLIMSTAAIGILCAPMAIFLLNRSDWDLGWYTLTPRPFSVVRRFYVLAGGAAPLVVYFLASLLGVAAAVRSWRASWATVQGWRYGVVVAWLLVPMAIAYAASFVSPTFISRYLSVSLPALVLLVACGIAQIRRTVAQVAAVAVFAVVAAYAIGTYYATPSAENWRDAARFLLSRADPTDAVMIYAAPERPAYEYYRRRLGGPSTGPMVVFPADPKGGVWEAGSVSERRPDDALLEAVASRYQRVWLILSHHRVESLGRDVVSRSLRQFLASRYRSIEEVPFGDIRVLSFTR